MNMMIRTSQSRVPSAPNARSRAYKLLAATLVAMPVLMGADVYRWVDANGVVNYTQQKPEGVEWEMISRNVPRRSGTRNSPSDSSAVAVAETAPTAGSAELSAQQQAMLEKLKAAEAERNEAIAAARRDNCARSRELLARLSARGRIRVNQDDGTQIVMKEEDRQARIQAAQQGVIENC